MEESQFVISVTDNQDHVAVDENWLRTITESVFAGEGISSAEVSVAIVDDPAIHDINRRFLSHDYPTDVISFPLADSGEGRIEGEVVISGETASRRAAEWGAEPREELALYLVHGLLHLCGYDDHSQADCEEMRQREQAHLQKFGIRPHYDD